MKRTKFLVLKVNPDMLLQAAVDVRNCDIIVHWILETRLSLHQTTPQHLLLLTQIIINNHLSNYRFSAHCISLNNILWVWQHQSWFMLFAITKPLFMSRSNPENWATTELHPGYRRFPCPWSYFSVARFVQTPIKWLYQFQAIHLNTFFVYKLRSL